jgi:hypothetical protein
MNAIGFERDADLMAMHFAEFEIEAENVLELLAVLRANSRASDSTSAQDTAAELVIALEHLAHHLGGLLPPLQKKLDLEP